VLLSEIIEKLGWKQPSEFTDLEITAISSPARSTESTITFLNDTKYREAITACSSPAVVVRTGEHIEGKLCIEVDDPYVAFARLGHLFENTDPVFGMGIHSTAVVDPSAVIDPTAAIGPYTVIAAEVTVGCGTVIGAHCVIEKASRIGEQCRIDSGAVIRRDVIIGNRVIVQSCAVIGSEGFGNARQHDRFIRIPSFGTVVIEDDAEIGACTTIDRGALEDTVIGKGVKIDNLVQIAHNVTIEENSAIAAQSGLSGSTHVGKCVLIGGQAGFSGHNRIGDRAFIGAKAGVSKDVDAGAKVTGYPARDLMKMRRIEASMQHLPSVIKDIREIKKRIEQKEQ
jgi:UDP-3-O-[3-hydroxymyristoyl] glucosamine N-acyltransferase